MDQGGRFRLPPADVLFGPGPGEELFEDAPAQADGHAPDCYPAAQGNAGGVKGKPSVILVITSIWVILDGDAMLQRIQ